MDVDEVLAIGLMQAASLGVRLTDEAYDLLKKEIRFFDAAGGLENVTRTQVARGFNRLFMEINDQDLASPISALSIGGILSRLCPLVPFC